MTHSNAGDDPEKLIPFASLLFGHHLPQFIACHSVFWPLSGAAGGAPTRFPESIQSTKKDNYWFPISNHISTKRKLKRGK